MVDVDAFVGEVFKSQPSVRFVGIVDNKLHVLVAKMREGTDSFTSEADDHNYLQIVPNILIDVAEKLSPAVGSVESVTIRYEKILMVFFRLENLTILLSFEPTVVRPFMSALSDLMRTLGSRYLR